MTGRELMLILAFAYDWNYGLIINELTNKTRDYDVDELKVRINEWLEEHTALTIVDEEYPNALKNMAEPPLILEYEGDLSALRDTYIGMDDEVFAKEFHNNHKVNVMYPTKTGFTFINSVGKECWIRNKGYYKPWMIIAALCGEYVISNDKSLSEKMEAFNTYGVDVVVKLDSLQDKRKKLLRNKDVRLYIDEKDVDF